MLASAARTGALLVVHEAVQVGGFGAEIAAVAAEATGCRVRRLGAPRIPSAMRSRWRTRRACRAAKVVAAARRSLRVAAMSASEPRHTEAEALMSRRGTAIVTGAASGIGAATAHELAARGYASRASTATGPGVNRSRGGAAATSRGAHLAFEVDVADEPALVAAFATRVSPSSAGSTRSSPAPASPT